MVVFHPSTLRGGDPTHHSETRRTLSLRFFGDDALVASRPGAKRTGKTWSSSKSSQCSAGKQSI